MSELNEKQGEILKYIIQYKSDKGFAPSIREICKKFGFSSPRAGQKYLETLEDKGYIQRASSARSIKIISPTSDTAHYTGIGPLTTLPFLGYIAAGAPIEVIEQKEEIEVPRTLVSKKPCYILQVKGNSMIEDHIIDGDFIVVEKCDTADDGEVVVALVNNDSATLKRIYREKDRVRLEPANSSMKPIYVKDVAIQGKIKGLFRKF